MKLLRSAILLLCCALAMSVAQARYDKVEYLNCIARDDVDCVRSVLAEGQFNANTFSNEGFTALYLALREPAPQVADFLIEQPATDLNLENAWGENALMMAALKGLRPQAIRMMELGAHVNKEGWAPLHYAASSGNLPMIKLLLDNYAYIDAQSPKGDTPLMMAAARGTPAAVQMLLDAEADATLKNSAGKTAIDLALARGNTNNAKIIRDWLLRGGKPSASPSPAPAADTKSTPLDAALGSGSIGSNNYGGPQATPTPTPTPLPSPSPSSTSSPTPSPTLAATPIEEIIVRPVPAPGTSTDATAEVTLEPTAEPSPSPSPTPTPTPSPAPTAPPQAPAPVKLPASVADVIAAPVSRAMLQMIVAPDASSAPPSP